MERRQKIWLVIDVDDVDDVDGSDDVDDVDGSLISSMKECKLLS